MPWEVLDCIITVKTKNRCCSRGILKTVGLLTGLEAYFSKKEAMGPMGASFLAISKVALVC